MTLPPRSVARIIEPEPVIEGQASGSRGVSARERYEVKPSGSELCHTHDRYAPDASPVQ